ncbi:ribonuclease HII [Aureibacillus halotolerans]|uniref:Ribonuclease HII n=1 Tax=Aureibacillus halotolerans TaxID=1508390 RepID=A0A4V3D633_9BACI|nr:ribonuclease HII [Aureibacillus halotolerans]TDQ42407.1 RNase HII [Aureibacillus halotolerans]
MKATIKEIKQRLQEGQLTPEEFASLQSDQREGVKKLLLSYERIQQKDIDAQKRFREMGSLERSLRSGGYTFIAGVDEAGRGPLAGPVVAGAVVLPEDFYYPELNDSKKMTAAAREHCYEYLLVHAYATGVGIMNSQQIDKLNIYEATRQAMVKAVQNMDTPLDYVLVDAMTLPMPYAQASIIKGDQRSLSIAAGSVIAKVTRDRLMKRMAKTYPGYGFDVHMGYGTKQHVQALQANGPCEIHRKSFQPVKAVL